MLIRLCRASLDRMEDKGASLTQGLRDEEHTVLLEACLNRCGACQAGMLVTMVDGFPMQHAGVAAFREDLAKVGVEDDFFDI